MQDDQMRIAYQKDELHEADLVGGLIARDPEALAAIYCIYKHQVYSILRTAVCSKSAAEDLVQELFFKLWHRACLFDSNKGSLGAWIFSLARNIAIDHMRSGQRQWESRCIQVDAEQSLPAEHCRRAESTLHRAIAVEAALRTLSFNERRVLELSYFEGYSQSEIAVALRKPLGTVKAWTRSALANLRTVKPRKANSVFQLSKYARATSARDSDARAATKLRTETSEAASSIAVRSWQYQAIGSNIH